MSDILSAGLAQALVIRYHRRCKPGTSIDDIVRGARAAFDEVQKQLKGAPNWDVAEPATIARLRAPALVGVPVRLAGFITKIRTPHFIDLPASDVGRIATLTTEITIQDPNGLAIESVDIVGDDMVSRAYQHAQRTGMLEVLGRVVSIPEALETMCHVFAFEVCDIRRTTSILDLMGATGEERRFANERLKELGVRGISPLDFLIQSVASGLGIVGLERSPERAHSLRFVGLQSVSGGRVGSSSGKLSGLLIGKPGSSKGTLLRAARALNPRCAEVSSARASMAGIGGASYATADGWHSSPGLVDIAHEGVLTWPDMHALTEGKMTMFAPAIQSIVEEGRLVDAIAGGRARDVSVGLLMDLNRLADVGIGGGRRREAAIIRTRPIMSRVDFVQEIPSDMAIVWEIGALMAQTVDATSAERPEDQPWARPLQLIAATLRDKHHAVDMSAVRGEIEQAVRAIEAENRERFALIPEAGDIPPRLVTSIFRYVVASSRANDRSTATHDDVLEALAMAQSKLSFIGLAAGAASQSPHEHGFGAREQVYARHGGQVVAVEDLAKEVHEATGDGVKTVRRDLSRLGARKVGPGRYELPASIDDDADE